MAATIEWSHDLLDERDRIVFRRLAVFQGEFTLDALRSVAAGGIDSLPSTEVAGDAFVLDAVRAL